MSAFEDDHKEDMKDPEYRAAYYKFRNDAATGKIHFLEYKIACLENKNDHLRSLITEWDYATFENSTEYGEVWMARYERACDALRKEVNQ